MKSDSIKVLLFTMIDVGVCAPLQRAEMVMFSFQNTTLSRVKKVRNG